MPELPEVETVRKGLMDWTLGRTITAVEVRHPRAVRRHLLGARDFADKLRGQVVEGVHRRGKYLWFELSDFPLIAHLGMSGQFRVEKEELAHPHVRVHFTLNDGILLFLDQRTFGGFHIDQWSDKWSDEWSDEWSGDRSESQVPLSISHIGLDPFEPSFDLDRAVAQLRGKDSEVKRVLLDQRVVSGVGNIYADEALFLAGVHPRRIASSLTRAQAQLVLEHARAVMAAALEAGGTSFDALYVNVNGESGYFDRALQVYQRDGQPCPRCGALIKREEFMNRGSHFCPRCQRAPRSR